MSGHQRIAEHELDKAFAHAALQAVGLQTQDIGQELLTSSLRDAMKAFPHYWLRWVPDIMTCQPNVVAIPFLVEVKKGDGPYANVAIEQDSLRAALLLAATGLPVIFLASFRSAGVCRWAWAAVASRDASRGINLGNGSGTPFVTVPKESFRPIEELPDVVGAYTRWWDQNR